MLNRLVACFDHRRSIYLQQLGCYNKEHFVKRKRNMLGSKIIEYIYNLLSAINEFVFILGVIMMSIKLCSMSLILMDLSRLSLTVSWLSSGSRGGPRGPWPPPGPVKIGHKKDGRQRRPHRFHVSRSPPYPAAGSATAKLATDYLIDCILHNNKTADRYIALLWLPGFILWTNLNL